ncbi:MAG: hypothetical protein AAF840_11100, partial [Bacteroidota bacterium]
MKHLMLLLSMVYLLTCCDASDFEDGATYYADDFSAYTTFDDLFPNNDLAWTSSQLTGGDNLVRVDATFFRSAPAALSFSATKSSAAESSKCSVVKQN